MKIEITKDQYQTIKTLFKAASDDASRPALSNVFWDHETKNLVACDGHILRLEPMEFPFVESVQFEQKSFLLTPKQVKTMYPKTSDMIEVEYIDNKENVYPNYKNVLNKVESQDDLNALKMIAFGFEVIEKFYSSFTTKPESLTMAFIGAIRAVNIYRGTQFVGVIMPHRIKEEPLPESKEEKEGVTA
jgi:hypothetical protein